MLNHATRNATIDEKERQRRQPHLQELVLSQLFESIVIMQPSRLELSKRHLSKQFTCPAAQKKAIMSHL